MTDIIHHKAESISADNRLSQIGHKKISASGRVDSAGTQQGVTAALRILEPARKKLSTIETQRIIECLDESIRRHELASSTLLILLADNDLLEKYSLALGIELVTALKSHKTFCRMLEDATAKHDETTAAVLHGQVNESCKNLLRLFSKNPTVATAIRGEYQVVADNGNQPLQDAKKLIRSLMDLRAIMFQRLLTTPIEETDRSKYLLQVSEREKNNAAIIDKLQTQLDAAVEDKEQELNKRNETIRRLKNDLHQIEQFSEEHVRRTKTEADKQQAADTRSSEGKQSKQIIEIELLQDQLSKNFQEHREVEQALRKRKYKIETEVDNWITKYDQDMGEKQEEYEQIDAIYTEEKKQLSELEEKFKVLEEEYDKIMEERRIAREQKEAKELELQLMIKAAITVQAYFRAYKVRKALKAKAKKGGKGKGKGKKKK